MIIHVYKSEKENMVCALPKNTPEESKLLPDDAILIKKIEGKDWDDCMTKYHEFMGYEKYIPMED